MSKDGQTNITQENNDLPFIIDSTNVFNYVPNDCKIIVPDSLYESWITASNWSDFASQIVKESEA